MRTTRQYSWENCPEEPRERQSEDYVLVRFAIDQALGAFCDALCLCWILAHIDIITLCIYNRL